MRIIPATFALLLLPFAAMAQVQSLGLGLPGNPDWAQFGNGQFVMNDAMIFTGTVPVVANGASDCGTAPVIAGNNNAMRVTVGTGTNGGKCTVTFATNNPFINAPVCFANDEVTVANIVKTQPAVLTVVLVAVSTLTAGDTIGVTCTGFK